MDKHSYVITDVRDFKIKGSQVHRILKLYNVWGQTSPEEWQGNWSDNCKLWGLVSKQDKNKIDFKIELDGEFW